METLSHFRDLYRGISTLDKVFPINTLSPPLSEAIRVSDSGVLSLIEHVRTEHEYLFGQKRVKSLPVARRRRLGPYPRTPRGQCRDDPPGETQGCVHPQRRHRRFVIILNAEKIRVTAKKATSLSMTPTRAIPADVIFIRIRR